VVQLAPSGEVWIWKDLPAAVSQLRTTWLMLWLAPRSTCSHCGSEKALDQRVPALPSTAIGAVKLPFSEDDAVAVLPCESRVAGPPPGSPGPPPSDGLPYRASSYSESPYCEALAVA
jgi:hypothetical protein